MRYKCSGLDQAAIIAELRERFGETCTRAEIMQYREESGNDPRWIRKGQSCNIGRGLYRIPGGQGGSSPVMSSVVTPKLAKREKVVKDDELVTDDRSVISTPFDDGHYDEDAPVAEKSKRGRKVKEVVEPFAGRELDAAGELPAPVYVHAWICDARTSTTHCPGRKPGTAYGPDGAPPVCECGSPMSRHAWAPSKKLF